MSMDPALGIGALEKLSGIPAATLRTWERRYGFPVPARSEGGHRTYDFATVERLELIAAALSAGHRASHVVPAEVGALRRLVGAVPKVPVAAAPEPADLMGHVRAGDPDGLERALAAALAARGAVPWVREVVAPLLYTIGEAWAAGNLAVAEEHLAAEVIRAQLRTAWRSLEPRQGRVAVFAGVPGERHDLGLHMAAVVLAQAGWRVVFLGADTPVADIVAAGSAADAVFVSCAQGADPEGTAAALTALVAALPGRVVAGGAGVPEVPGVVRPVGLAGLAEWASP